ncbi:hypothetical protein BOX15_Mlig022256g1, partial [Macrostomum lignano]
SIATMWSASQYGGGNDADGTMGGGGGGGFMNSPGPAGGRGGGGRGGGGPNRINSVTPCTCAELLAAVSADDQFTSPTGIPLGQVTIVGVVRQLTRSAARIDYQVDDYTGAPIDVKQFVDNESEDDPSANLGDDSIAVLEEGDYVRVYGQLRNMQGSRAVSAFKVTKLADMNELSFHLVHVVRARMSAQGGPANGGGSQPMMSSDAARPNGLAGLASPSAAGMNKLEQQVLAILRDGDCDEGLHVQRILERLPGVPIKRLKDVLSSLGDEGHIYTSTDDDHFRLIQ